MRIWVALAVAGCAPRSPAGAAHDALPALAERIAAAFTNDSGELSPDGRWLAFVSDRDGLPQVYLAPADRPGDAPHRIVMPERCQRPQFTPDSASLVIACDHGDDGMFALYRARVAGGEPVEMFPGRAPTQRRAFVPDRGGGAVIVSQRTNDDPRVEVLRVDAAGREATSLYTDPGPGNVVAVSRDGARVAVLRRASASDSQLLVVELAGGGARRLYPPAGSPPVAIQAARFSADGARVLVATDAGGEGGVLLALDVATGAELARFAETQPATAALASVQVSPRGDLVAVGINAGDHSAVRLLDARTLAPRTVVSVPLGDGDVLGFSADGARLVIDWTTPDAPVELYYVDVATGALRPARSEPRRALADLPPVETELAEIPTADGLTIHANVYRPKGGTRVPVIVSIHGGPAGSSTIGFDAANRFWLALGYAIVEPNVRGSAGFGRAFEMADDGAQRRAAIGDLATVARWIQHRDWADGERLIAMGQSYGGYMALMALADQPALWRAAIDMSGVTNLRTFMASTSASNRVTLVHELGDPATAGAFLDEISPLHNVDRIVAPVFVFHGANDNLVPPAEAEQLVAALRARGVPVELMIAPDEGHSLDHRANQVALLARSARFLEKALVRPRPAR